MHRKSNGKGANYNDSVSHFEIDDKLTRYSIYSTLDNNTKSSRSRVFPWNLCFTLASMKIEPLTDIMIFSINTDEPLALNYIIDFVYRMVDWVSS